MIWTESWDPEEFEVLEKVAKVRSLALDPAWADAASTSGFARPCRMGLRDADSLRAACLGLKRSRGGFSKLVCGTNGGVGLIAADLEAAREMAKNIWRRWRPSEMQVFALESIDDDFRWEPAYTFHLDLRQSLDEIRRRLLKATRKHLDRALRDGVTASSACGGGEVEEAFDIIEGTARMKGFKVPPRSYLLALHECFGKSGLGELVVAKRDGRILSAVQILGARGIASWWKGGSSEEGYRDGASTVAEWEAIKIAKDRDLGTYDFGGTHPTNATYSAIHQHKASFGGTLVKTALGDRVTPAARVAKWLRTL